MYSCLIWGTGLVFHKNIPLLRFYELNNDIEIKAITSRDTFYKSVAGYTFIKKEKIISSDFDRVIIMAEGKVYKAIYDEAIAKGFRDCDIVPCSVMGIVGFDFAKYKLLRKNTPTIFAPNCWGGITYHMLGLPFKSPLINMFVEAKDYIKFLGEPRRYIQRDLEYVKNGYNEEMNIEYPIVMCDDILFYFNHYTSFECANESWVRRKQRIDWSNVFVMFYDERPEYIKEFCEMPYKNKICFAPRNEELEHSCILTIDYKKEQKDEPLYNIVNRCGKGEIVYYDIFELLLNGRAVTKSDIGDL